MNHSFVINDSLPSSKRRQLLTAGGAAALSMFAGLARANGTFPDKPVRIIVPTAPGSGSDILARNIAERMSTVWGQPVTVENRAGASGIIGVDAVVRSPADGYTLLMSSASPVTINPMLFKKLPYDPQRSLTPISQVGIVQSAFLINAVTPATDLAQFIALAKANPGHYTYGSFGIGSGHHLGVEAFSQAAGIKMTHIPYKGTAPELNALLGAQITCVLTDPTPAQGHIKSGKLRALAVNGPKRHPMLPEIPTFTELGYPEVEGTYGSFAFFAPYDTSAPIVEKIAADVRAILAQPDLRDRFHQNGYILAGGTPAELAASMKSDAQRWSKVIKAAGGISLD